MNINDVIKTKKQHPCGGQEWQVLRMGADYKLKCTTCNHIIMVTSEKFKKMIKE